MTISPVAGDGVGSPALRANIQLPDSGNTVGVQGIYYPDGKIPQGIITNGHIHGTVPTLRAWAAPGKDTERGS